jgi:hypothetical protein
MTHTTGYVGGNCENFEYTRNKVIRIKDMTAEVPRGKADTRVQFNNLGGKISIEDNVWRKVNDEVRVGTSNVVSNDPNVVPKGYVEIRPGLATGEAAGRVAVAVPDTAADLAAIEAKAPVGSRWTNGPGRAFVIAGHCRMFDSDEWGVLFTKVDGTGNDTVQKAKDAADFFVKFTPA